MKVFELNPINGRKSFYGKAVVIEKDKVFKLKSYNTIVAEYNEETEEIKINGYYSQTTGQHINSFLSHFGFNTMTKKEIESFSSNVFV